ncbi:uncharacterized protein HD556DRAFT_1241185 [Suillus plorans]|uniref:Uncharacterized protein n=1 Tax=Suillus plorans TaxID=116603 RepID=A0A9P7ALU7_9AGAM|nr:uncharacterized protein HD556DRAFT_1241185 [Suillus plorans]KAG1791017.1 hypothetical protein HD556DRAFT_1241185 [Suillus plorans]
MIKSLDLEIYDLAYIQEPYLNLVNLANTSNLRSWWDVIYLADHHSFPQCSQVIMLVNKRLLKNTWHIVLLKPPNTMSIELTGPFGKVHIYNIYNPCDSNHTLDFLE